MNLWRIAGYITAFGIGFIFAREMGVAGVVLGVLIIIHAHTSGHLYGGDER